MPKVNIDYSKTIIYKIVCNDMNITDCYVGQTTNFTKRKTCHKRDCNTEHRNGYTLKIYRTIRENGGWEQWSMIEIEKYPCSDGNEARARERHWFETLQATLNSSIPNRSQLEWNQKYNEDHRDEVKDYHKQYHEKNKEARNERKREKILCPCGKTIIRSDISRHNKSQSHIKIIESKNELS